MKKWLWLLLVPFLSQSIFAADQKETIVVIRHAEKTPIEMGQLSCQGLNRALKLPYYFEKHFGKPDFIFAPNPSVQIARNAEEKFSYVRALATIEPTAIYFQLPVDAQIGFNQPDQLMNQLLEKKYHNKKIFVAWESMNINKFTHMMLSRFHNTSTFDELRNDHFNRVLVFQIDWNKQPAVLSFQQQLQTIKNINVTCPI